MATASAVEHGNGPPDTRGGTAPLPASALGIGAASLIAVLGGTIFVQIAYALSGGDITQRCVDELAVGINKELPRGALGVCHILEGIDSPIQSVLLYGGIVAGVIAMAEKIADGKPEQIQKDPKVIEAYLGSGAGGEAATTGTKKSGNGTA